MANGLYDGTLASIPGLGGWNQQNAINEQQTGQNLQHATGAISLLGQIHAQQEELALKQTLAQSGGDLTKAMQALVQSGNVAGAAKLAPLLKLQREKEATDAMAGAGQMTPDQLDALGQKLAAAGHPGAATIMGIADKRRAAASNADTVASMRDTPQPIAPGTMIGNQRVEQAIPPDEVAAYLKVAGANGPATATPEAGDPKIMGGGALSGLMESKSPAIAAQARQLQAMINNPNFKGDPNQLQTRINNLAMLDARLGAAKPSTAWHPTPQGYMKDGPNGPEPVLTSDGKPIMPSSAAQPGITLTADALDAAAARYRIDGTLPANLGRGTQGGQKTAEILNRAAEQAKALGQDAEAQRLNQLANKSISTALTALERQRANVMTYEKTALAGADIALEMSDKVDRSGIPLVNKWVNAGRVALTGDPDVTRLNNATETLTNEYAKVMSGSSGGQATTVSMQEHARQMLSAAQTKEQFAGVVNLMKREMKETREKAFDAQISEMRGRMGGGNATAPAAGGWSIRPK